MVVLYMCTTAARTMLSSTKPPRSGIHPRPVSHACVLMTNPPMCWPPGSSCSLYVCHIQQARPAAARAAAAAGSSSLACCPCCCLCCCHPCCRCLGPHHCTWDVCYIQGVAQQLVGRDWPIGELQQATAPGGGTKRQTTRQQALRAAILEFMLGNLRICMMGLAPNPW